MEPQKPRLVDLRGGREAPPQRPRERREQPARRSSLKLRRQRTRALITAAVCVCILLSSYALHLASYAARFTFQQVEVSGNKSLSTSFVQLFVEDRLASSSKGFISGRNIFIFDVQPLEKAIMENFPQVKTARVSKPALLGNTIAISIEERQPFALWCAGESARSCYLLDESGVVFAAGDAAATSSLPSQYVFRGELSTTTIASQNPPYGESFSPEHFLGLRSLLEALALSGVHPTGVLLENATDFRVLLTEGFYIKASYGTDPNQLAKNLQLVLSSDALTNKTDLLEYVDLRFGNRVYYKFANQPEAQ